MKFQWQNLLLKAVVWLSAEVILNLIGLDDMADYGEFVLEHKPVSIKASMYYQMEPL